MTGNPLELFRKLFGAVRAIFWLCGSLLAPNFLGVHSRFFFRNSRANGSLVVPITFTYSLQSRE